jgi:hypothetical protein
MRNKTKKYYLAATFIIAMVALAMALPPAPPGGGPGGGGPPGGGPPCWPPPCNPIPIDGGLTYLLAAGAVLGGRKLYKMNNKG